MTPSTIPSPAAASVLPMLLSPTPANTAGGEPAMAFSLDIPHLDLSGVAPALPVAPTALRAAPAQPIFAVADGAPASSIIAPADDSERHEDADTGTDLPATPDDLPLDPALAWLALAPPVVVPAISAPAQPPAATRDAVPADLLDAPRAASLPRPTPGVALPAVSALTAAPLPTVAPAELAEAAATTLPPTGETPTVAATPTDAPASETMVRAVSTTALTPLPDVVPAPTPTTVAPTPGSAPAAMPDATRAATAAPVAVARQNAAPAPATIEPATPQQSGAPAVRRAATQRSTTSGAAPAVPTPPARSSVAAAAVAVPIRFQTTAPQPIAEEPVVAVAAAVAPTPIASQPFPQPSNVDRALVPALAAPIVAAPDALAAQPAAAATPGVAAAQVVAATPVIAAAQPVPVAPRTVAPQIAASQPAAFLRQTAPTAPRPTTTTTTTATPTAAPSVEMQPPSPVATPAARVFGAAIHAAAVQRSDPRPASLDPRPATSPAEDPAPVLVADAPIAADALPTMTTAAEVRSPLAVSQIVQAPLDVTQRQWPQTMISRIEGLRDMANAADTSIRLIPDALGKIDVSMRTDGDTVHVEFAAEQAATRQLLQDAAPRLHAAAEERGLKLGETRVAAVADSSPQNGTSNGASTGQQGGSPSGSGSASAGTQQQQGHNQHQHQQQREATRNTANRAPRATDTTTTDSDAADQAGGRIA